MNKNGVLIQTNIPEIELISRGKVRDIYAVGDKLLIVATRPYFRIRLHPGDRHSLQGQSADTAFAVLVRLPEERAADPHHYGRCRRNIPSRCPNIGTSLKAARCWCAGRRCLRSSVSRAAICPAPAGRITDGQEPSAAFQSPQAYRKARNCRNLSSPRRQRPRPGHDENISFEQAAKIVGASRRPTSADLTLDIYGERPATLDSAASSSPIPSSSSVLVDGELVLADEVLTPDSSRFWPASDLQPRRRATLLRQAIRPRLPRIHLLEQADPRAVTT